MPLASKPGAPRPKTHPGAPERRRCIGPITLERARTLHASGVLSDADFDAICEMSKELDSRDPQDQTNPLDFSK